MKTLVVYVHPNPKSFNAAIKETVVNELTANGHKVRVRDLYALNFNPILNANDFEQLAQNQIPGDIKIEQDEIAWADNLVFVYPTWWTNMPAMLKGYLDRVLQNGFAFRYTEAGAVPLLVGKKAIIFQTTGQPKEVLEEYNQIGSLKVEMGTLDFTGIEIVTHELYHAIPYITDEMREQILVNVKQVLNKISAVNA